jgi:hypothetical protein
MNRRSIYCRTRYELAQKSFDKPVVIVTQAEAGSSEKGFSERKKHGNLALKRERFWNCYF